jgi:predicted MPP superfamily phosphohydrolase
MDEPDKPAVPPKNERAVGSVRIFKLIGIVTILSILLLAYSYFIEPHRLVVNTQELHISNASRALDGLRIVAISDIHGGSNGVDEARIRQIVETANAQDADLIVLLGDHVSELPVGETDGQRRLRMPVETIARNLKGLKAKFGVFAVLGNHDEWYGGPVVAEALESVGVTVLDGEVAVIERGGTPLRILGTKDHQQVDTWAGYAADARRLLAPTEGSGDVIVLQHSPDIAEMITGDLLISSDLKLLLAGHTHGGQVWLPVLGRPLVPSSYGQKFAAGHVREYGLDIFVTTGVGTSILPFRFMVAPEIAVLTLSRE